MQEARRYADCTNGVAMDIRFISSLTAEDEDAFAPALLKAVSAVLDHLPIAYTLRIETTGSQVLHHVHRPFDSPPLTGSRLVLNTLKVD